MDNNNIHHLPTYKKPRAGLDEDSKKTVKHKIPVEDLRNVSISLKVSEGQNRHIKSLAKQCNMSRSSYMLARAYNYQPRTRPTIAKCKAIPHGSNLLQYNDGESRWKTEKDKILHVANRFCSDDIDAAGLWEMIKLRTGSFRLMKNTMLRFELSPPKEYTQDFTREDWAKLWDDYMTLFDNIEFVNQETGKVTVPKTNIRNSLQSAWVHYDSKSGVPHLHVGVCRVDEDGNVNQDHLGASRAILAGWQLALQRGWKTPMECEQNQKMVSKDYMSILKGMKVWNLNEYFDKLRELGYTVKTLQDKQGVVHGYSLERGRVFIKASELGKGRNLLFGKLASTWAEIHKESSEKIVTPQAEKDVRKPDKPVLQPSVQFKESSEQNPKVMPDYLQKFDYTRYEKGHLRVEIELDGKKYNRFIPEKVLNLFDDEVDWREVENYDEIKNYFAAMFTFLLGGEHYVPTTGGGGSDNNRGWRDKDEDDLAWARRCINCACKRLPKVAKSKGLGW